MSSRSRTFVVKVHPEDRRAVVEDVRSGERVPLDGLSGLAGRIERWLGRAEPERSAPEVESPAAASSHRRSVSSGA